MGGGGGFDLFCTVAPTDLAGAAAQLPATVNSAAGIQHLYSIVTSTYCNIQVTTVLLIISHQYKYVLPDIKNVLYYTGSNRLHECSLTNRYFTEAPAAILALHCVF